MCGFCGNAVRPEVGKRYNTRGGKYIGEVVSKVGRDEYKVKYYDKTTGEYHDYWLCDADGTVGSTFSCLGNYNLESEVELKKPIKLKIGQEVMLGNGTICMVSAELRKGVFGLFDIDPTSYFSRNPRERLVDGQAVPPGNDSPVVAILEEPNESPETIHPSLKRGRKVKTRGGYELMIVNVDAENGIVTLVDNGPILIDLMAGGKQACKDTIASLWEDGVESSYDILKPVQFEIGKMYRDKRGRVVKLSPGVGYMPAGCFVGTTLDEYGNAVESWNYNADGKWYGVEYDTAFQDYELTAQEVREKTDEAFFCIGSNGAHFKGTEAEMKRYADRYNSSEPHNHFKVVSVKKVSFVNV